MEGSEDPRREKGPEAAPGELFLASPDYPQALRRISDPPAKLYVRGELPPGHAVAVVGSRDCTPYGRRTARSLGRDLARAGFVVVSGLARGIDAAAHRGALDAGGKTVAVLPCGIDRVYPRQHFGLAKRIAACGALVTELEPGTAVHAGTFHQRNRIIAGMAVGTVVVEAAPRSGTQITARFALEYDRELIAVPGPVDSHSSKGTNALLLEGAAPCTGIEALIDHLPPWAGSGARDRLAASRGEPASAGLDDEERAVLAAIAPGGGCAVNQLVSATGLPVPRLLAVLTDMEVRGLIRSVGAQRYERV